MVPWGAGRLSQITESIQLIGTGFVYESVGYIVPYSQKQMKGVDFENGSHSYWSSDDSSLWCIRSAIPLTILGMQCKDQHFSHVRV